MANEVSIRVTTSGDLKSLGTDAKQAGDSVEKGIKQGFQGAEKASSSATKAVQRDLSQVEQAGKSAGTGLKNSFGDAFDGISDLASSFGGEAGSLLSDGIMSARGGMLAAGVAVGSFVISGIQQEIAKDKVGGMLAAQTGAASGAAEKLGNTAGEVFANNFGDSIEQVGEAMGSIFENKLIDTSAPQAEIQKMTEKVITLAKVSGESFGDIAYSADQMVKTNIAGSVSEAMDLIGEAQQHGLNATKELLPTIGEYSTQFRKLGLDGKEAFGLLEQGAEGGARSIDTTADALKELSIRAIDGSATTKRGFETLGLDAEKMGQRFAAGGETANQALKETLNALQSLPPGVERSSAAVDLFGTQAEDLGDALYNLDLDDAGDKFKDFGGTVEDMAKRLSESESFWDRLGKGISNAAGAVGDFLDKDFSEMLDDMPELKAALEEINKAKQEFEKTGSTEGLDALKEKYPQVTSQVDEYIKKKREEQDANSSTASGYTELEETMDSYISKLQEAAGVVVGLHDSQRGYQQSLADAAQTIEDFGNKAKQTGEGLNKNRTDFDLATEAGREMQEALDDIGTSAVKAADDMEANGASVAEVNKHISDARARFISAATAMGISRAAANRMADALRLIPKKVSVEVALRNQAAMENLRAFKRALDNIQSKTITISTYVRGANISASGGGGHHFVQAAGGITPQAVGTAQTGGARNGYTLINDAQGDGELVILPNGSRVMTAGATRELARKNELGLDGLLNSDGSVQRLASGGIAWGSVSEARWNQLRAQGWKGDPNDGREMIYPPSTVSHRYNRPAPANQQPQVSMAISGAADQYVASMIKSLMRTGMFRLSVAINGRTYPVKVS